MLRVKLNVHSFVTVTFTLLIIFNSQKDTSVFGQRIGGDIFSTLRIVGRLCFNPYYHNRNTVINFYGCYDYAPGKAQFETCQLRSFGNLLNTIPRIDATCRNPRNPQILEAYARCLQQEFAQAGINMQYAVTQVNICQGRVLGL